jgi:hypothetical protein
MNIHWWRSHSEAGWEDIPIKMSCRNAAVFRVTVKVPGMQERYIAAEMHLSRTTCRFMLHACVTVTQQPPIHLKCKDVKTCVQQLLYIPDDLQFSDFCMRNSYTALPLIHYKCNRAVVLER